MITQPQFALGNDRVELWCKPTGTDGQRQQFYVINGCWTGYYDGSEVEVWRTGACIPARVLWQGTAPHSESNYNEAIAWIEQEIKNGTSGTNSTVHGNLSGVRSEHVGDEQLRRETQEEKVKEVQGGTAGLVDEPVGDYVDDVDYLEMRLRIKLTGTASPSREYWAKALKEHLAEMDYNERDDIPF